MVEPLTAALFNTDTRFAMAADALRAIFPGAVVVAKYADDAPRDPQGHIVGTATPLRLELTFMPPPGLDYDSRHPVFAAMELADVATNLMKAITAEFDDLVTAHIAKHPDEPLDTTTLRVVAAHRAAVTATQWRLAYTNPEAPGDTKPAAADVIAAAVAAEECRLEALGALRMEEACCLAPAKDTRDEVDAATAAATGDRPGVPTGGPRDPVSDPGSPDQVSARADPGSQSGGGGDAAGGDVRRPGDWEDA